MGAGITRVCAVLPLALGLGVLGGATDGPEPGASRRAEQQALRDHGGLVGTWRGVGQVERGRARGSWTESASWEWKLTRDTAALALTVQRGKHLRSGLLRPTRTPGVFHFDAVLPDGKRQTYQAEPKPAPSGDAPRPLVLTAVEPVAPSAPRRITITPRHDTRLLLLFESEGEAGYERLGEVGYTREGVTFAASEAGPVCVVTGGRGTIAVSYRGQTYHVCCSGCRDLFNENPAAILAEAQAKRASPPNPR